MRNRLLALVLVLPLFLNVGHKSAAQNVSYRLVKVTSVDKPTDIASRSGDTGLYIAQQDGRLVRFDSVTQKVTTALDLTKFTNADGERGLLGVVFHPNGKFLFVNYTDAKGDTVVVRYAMRTDQTANPTSRVVLFTVDQPYANHNGGGLAFGPGGLLYIGTGDGGSRDDPQRRALSRRSMLGKIIAVDPLAANTKTAKPTIWSIGLRNPWRFEFDESQNLWIADVGRTSGKRSTSLGQPRARDAEQTSGGAPTRARRATTPTKLQRITLRPSTCTNMDRRDARSRVAHACERHHCPHCAVGTSSATTAAEESPR